MSETWVVCASCGLRRRTRAGGACARCHSTEALPTVAAPMMVAPTMEAPAVAAPRLGAPTRVAPTMVAPSQDEPEMEGLELDLETPELDEPEAPAGAKAGKGSASAAPAKSVIIAPVRINAMRTPSSLIVQDGSPLRWAGALLLGGVLLALVEMGLLRAQYLIDTDQLGGRFAVVLVDAVLGTLLLLGREQYRQMASVRAVLGGVIFTLMHLIEGHGFLAAGQLLNSIILMTLLSAEPQRDRVRLALGAALGLLLMQGVGIHLMLKHKRSVYAAEQNLRRMEAIHRLITP